MVTFILAEESNDKLIYRYYPDGDQTKRPGVIAVNKDTKESIIIDLAEGDWEFEIPVDDLNDSIDFINQGKMDRGETDLLEPATESMHSIYYGDHAVSEIQKYLRRGVFPTKGSQTWY